MKISTISGNTPIQKPLRTLLVIAFWVAVWHLLSVLISQEILLVSPVKVAVRLFSLVQEGAFWLAVANTLLHIFAGLMLAVAGGVLLAGLSARFGFVRTLFAPVLALIQSTPVASFSILALLWIKSQNLSLFIAFVMVLPVIYFNVLTGIEQTDLKLLEMARVFRMPGGRLLSSIYIPSIAPYFVTACRVGLGFAWKSGIAAEVITLPNNTIGINLYNAKIYFSNADLLAWTVVVVLLSVAMEQLVIHWSRYLQSGGSQAATLAKGGEKDA